ncbi:MAG: hypothetical protein HY475_01175 [Candidatus Terrybacteria bacterium]|nr:hypothetical protein [Candidatus Terrybacteria bacterium]
MALDVRRSTILETLVRAYLHGGAPLSSQFIAGRMPFPVSSATVRNEMAVLEKEGYLVQPHVSAGRIPTAEALRIVVHRMREQRSLEHVTPHRRAPYREVADSEALARRLACEVHAAAFIASGAREVFAGFEFVLASPELRDGEALADFAQLLNTAAFWRERLMAALTDPLLVFIADENPIFPTAHFSVVAARLDSGALAALVGPLRMRYDLAISSLDHFVTA